LFDLVGTLRRDSSAVIGTAGAGDPARELATHGKGNGLRCTVVEVRVAVAVPGLEPNGPGAVKLRFSARVAGLAIGGTAVGSCCCASTNESQSGGTGKGSGSGGRGGLTVLVSATGPGAVKFLIFPRIKAGLGGTIGSCTGLTWGAGRGSTVGVGSAGSPTIIFSVSETGPGGNCNIAGEVKFLFSSQIKACLGGTVGGCCCTD